MNTFNDVQYGRSSSQPIYSREDANRVRKEMEQERRLMRLQQVREESKNLARKIRTDVANEKDRQLRQLEFAKAQELENWRQHVLAQQHQDYRTAIFQVGGAHQAAQLEKQRMALRESNRAKAQGDFRQQLRARQSCNVPEKELNQQPLSLNAMECPSGGTQQQYVTDDLAKRKRNVCFNQVCSPGGNLENADESSELYSSCCDSSVTDSSMSPVCQRKAGLTKTPAIILDVDSDNAHDVSGRPREIKDNHVKSNRQFTKVVSDKSPGAPKAQASKKLFPKKAPVASKKPQPSKKPAASKKPELSTKPGHPTKPVRTSLPTKRTSTVPPPVTGRKVTTPKKKAVAPSASPQKTIATTTKSKTGATPKKVNLNAGSPAKRPTRFTAVSDLLRQRNAEQPPPPPNTSPRTSRSPSPERGRGKTPPPSFGSKSLKTTSLKSSVTIDKGGSLDTSATPANMPPLTVTARMTQMTASSASKGSSSGTLLSSGRVQFFDYRNKFTKEYTQPESAVRLEARESSQPNAMEQASIETGLRQTQAREFDNLRKKSDERGLMALEREQARRDCIDLTEKLEALSKQQPSSQFMAPNPPLLPPHHFVDQAAIRERKMNAAMEDIVLKPAIITCPVIDGDYYATQQGQLQPQQQQQMPQPRSGAPTVLNLGSNTVDFNQSNSSASCHSILLGYVNDQSQQLRNDLLECNSSDSQQEKTRKLKELLARIESLRDSLIRELERQSATSVAGKVGPSSSANVQNLMDTITDVQRQRDSLLERDSPNNTAEQLAELRRHEKECRDNRTRFEEQMRKLCELLQNASDEKAGVPNREKLPKRYTKEVDDKADGQENPDGGMVRKHVKSRPPKRTSSSGQAKQVKSPRRLSTLARVPTEVATGSKKNRHRQRSSLLKQQRQVAEPQPPAVVHSFDSNSTSYRSLPPTLTNRLDDAYQRAPQTPETSFNETENDSIPAAPRGRRPPAAINPLLAQYVNRLLAMSHRSSINALGVSSSEVDTPNSSVVNTSSNRRAGQGLPQRDDAWAEERMHRVRRFIQENHNFIQELESTLISNQSNANERITLETSMQAIEAIWHQRFGGTESNKENNNKLPPPQQQKIQAAAPKKTGDEEAKKRSSSKKAPGTPAKTKKSSEAKRKEKSVSESEPHPAEKTSPVAPPPSRTKLAEKQEPPPPPKRAPEASKSRSVQTQVQVPATEASAAEAEAQMARYDQMTRNCAERIEQLSGMINKVREEKLKLLESTYTSVSSNERNSTEYAELPHMTKGASDTSSTSSATVSSRGKPVTTPPPQPSAQGAPEPQPQQQSGPSSSAHALDKQKATGWSRDSGIYGSRPVTALGDYQAQSEAEPVSTSSHSAGPLSSASQIVVQQANKPRPPATLRRFSPQLVEEEAHELSTILEVDTPVTSRINASVQAAEAASSSTKLGQPVAFPTFEQYAQQTNLNLTLLDPNVSMMIEQEYNQLIAQLRDSSLMQQFSYEEFPSLTTYLRNTNEPSQGLAHDLNESPENVEELLNCLRLANVTLRSFPSHKDYVKEKRSDSTQDNELIDSSSLENVTSSSSSAQSNTLDIEEELKRRNIVTKTYRNDGHVVTASLSRSVDYGDTKIYAKVVTAESGVEKLSTSDNLSSDLEKELHGIGLAWTATMRKKGKEAAALGSTSSSTTPTASSLDPLPPGGEETGKRNGLQGGQTQMELPIDCALEHDSPHSTLIDEGQPLNLRDFLTRELMRRVNTSESNTSCTDDSLRSQFLNSIIDSLSPRTTAVPSNTATSAQNRTDRQKTSTPVPSNSALSRSRGGAAGGPPSAIPLFSSSSSTDITSSSHLFSGESRLSSVHYQDYPVVRFISSSTKEAKEEKAAPSRKPKDK